MASPEELLRAVYAAFNARDVDAAVARMAADVVWPNGMEGGVVHGREAVRAYWTRQWARIDPHVEPIAVAHEPDGRVVVEVRQVVRDRTGAVVADELVRHAYRLRRDLIASMEIREDRSA